MTLRQTLNEAKEKLARHILNAALDAEVLLAFTLQRPRSYLHAWPEYELTLEQTQHFAESLARRCQREPLAYIIGKREFWSLELEVNCDTLIPRPETELLVETALKLHGHHCIKVADLGTGSGAIALALAHERPAWQIFATDISESALQIANKNAQNLMLKTISFYQGDWAAALPQDKLDMIISNPPYIGQAEWTAYAEGLEFEPRQALVSGQQGLDAITAIIKTSRAYLRPQGYLLIEHGHKQGEAVRELLTLNAYAEINTLTDWAGKERVTLGCNRV